MGQRKVLFKENIHSREKCIIAQGYPRPLPLPPPPLTKYFAIVQFWALRLFYQININFFTMYLDKMAEYWWKLLKSMEMD